MVFWDEKIVYWVLKGVDLIVWDWEGYIIFYKIVLYDWLENVVENMFWVVMFYGVDLLVCDCNGCILCDFVKKF